MNWNDSELDYTKHYVLVDVLGDIDTSESLKGSCLILDHAKAHRLQPLGRKIESKGDRVMFCHFTLLN